MITSISEQNLRPYNTFRINAACDKYLEYTSANDIPAIMDMIGENQWISIGQGSNMLFVDDFHGYVLHSRILDIETESIEGEHVLMKVGSGVNMDQLIENLVSSGLWGAENLSGIPGEVGAAAVQNVGAYGVEACDFIKRVECYDVIERKFITLSVDECNYGYRDSLFKHEKNRFVVTYVIMELSTTPNPKIEYGTLKNEVDNPFDLKNIRSSIISVRNTKLPSIDEIGSAGSYFKNPIITGTELQNILHMYPEEHIPVYPSSAGHKLSAAWLIDKCGLKGYSSGNVAIWHNQPLVIVNMTGKASAQEVLELENLVINKVKEKFGICLSPEVEHVHS